MPQDAEQLAPLSVQRAFVVPFPMNRELAQGRWSSRLENGASGRDPPFASLKQLPASMGWASATVRGPPHRRKADRRFIGCLPNWRKHMGEKTKKISLFKSVGLLPALAVLILLVWSSRAMAKEPIVGFWRVTWTDASSGAVVLDVWDVWHSDHTETQDDTSPILFGNVCQGAWMSLGKRSFGLTHPAFNFLTSPENQEGLVDTTSSTLVLERVTVAIDGKTFKGTGIIKTIQGMNPLDPSAPLIGKPQTINLVGRRVTVDVSQLPPA